MPMYAYACKDCGHAFDIQQSFSDDSLAVCPECGGGLRKKFNSVGVVFKGSGFYRNDSRATTTSTDAGSSSSVSASSSDSSGSATAGSAAAASSGSSASSTGSTASATTGGSAAAS
ncbi:FmdB family zinc ribbon protein [Arthrobacter sp. NPDC092385]|uniref:FmdB family zinc ribbon protein n=1 Tax=Arthrobacter sp. NPDC092385 TaxID=3363943 RepID=UPI00381422C9